MIRLALPAVNDCRPPALLNGAVAIHAEDAVRDLANSALEIHLWAVAHRQDEVSTQRTSITIFTKR